MQKNNAQIAANSSNISATTIKRVFLLGSEWLYYKIYCGIKTADKIIPELLLPLSNELYEKKLIGKWFFIRYRDPDNHIRFRIKVKDKNNLSLVISRVLGYLEYQIETGFVSKLMVDTYIRELERYDSHTIEQAEDYFHIDSNSIANLLSIVEGEEREEIKWLYAVRSIDELLDLFSMNAEAKEYLMERLRTSFINSPVVF